MNLHRLALATLLGAAAVAPAHALVSTNTSGLTTTYFENFENASSFAGGVRINDGGDDYLSLVPNTTFTPGGSTASFSFTATADIASIALSFWYALPTNASGLITLASLSQPLGSTAAFLNVLGNNPGNGGDPSDAEFTTTLTNLAQGTYTLTFQSSAMKLDDVSIAVTAVPEPETYALMLGGMAVVGWVARRRRPGRD